MSWQQGYNRARVSEQSRSISKTSEHPRLKTEGAGRAMQRTSCHMRRAPSCHHIVSPSSLHSCAGCCCSWLGALGSQFFEAKVWLMMSGNRMLASPHTCGNRGVRPRGRSAAHRAQQHLRISAYCCKACQCPPCSATRTALGTSLPAHGPHLDGLRICPDLAPRHRLIWPRACMAAAARGGASAIPTWPRQPDGTAEGPSQHAAGKHA